jgi:hypothetical protein
MVVSQEPAPRSSYWRRRTPTRVLPRIWWRFLAQWRREFFGSMSMNFRESLGNPIETIGNFEWQQKVVHKVLNNQKATQNDSTRGNLLGWCHKAAGGDSKDQGREWCLPLRLGLFPEKHMSYVCFSRSWSVCDVLQLLSQGQWWCNQLNQLRPCALSLRLGIPKDAAESEFQLSRGGWVPEHLLAARWQPFTPILMPTGEGTEGIHFLTFFFWWLKMGCCFWGSSVAGQFFWGAG